MSTREKIGRWGKQHWRDILTIGAVVVVLGLVAWAIYLRILEHRDWAIGTGFGESVFVIVPPTPAVLPTPISPIIEYRPAKTLWDWLELLIVPLILAGGAYWFNRQEKLRDHSLAKERQQQEVLVDYLDKMSELLLKEDLYLYRDNPDKPILKVAQTRTTTTLRVLDKKRRDIVIQFLRDAGLEHSLLIKATLANADLENTDMDGLNLSEAVLHHTNLRRANLTSVFLRGADLEGADLEGADLMLACLEWANLEGANLEGANLNGASLQNANLVGANLVGTDLERADLEGANLNEPSLGWALKKEIVMPKVAKLEGDSSREPYLKDTTWKN